MASYGDDIVKYLNKVLASAAKKELKNATSLKSTKKLRTIANKANGKSSSLMSKSSGAKPTIKGKPVKQKSAAQIKESVGKSQIAGAKYKRIKGKKRLIEGKFQPVRGDYLTSTRSVREVTQGSRAGNFPSSKMKSSFVPAPKRKVQTQSPTNVKSVGDAVEKSKTMKTTKVVNPVSKPKKTYLKTKDREITVSPSEQREAERRATQMIRRSGDKPVHNPQPTSGQKPVGRPAPSSQDVSTHRTRGMDKNKGDNSRGRFEADKARAEVSADKKKFGKGQPMPKKAPAKKAPAKKAPARRKPAKQKSAPSSRYQNDMGSQLKRLKANIDNAKTPAAKRKAQQERMDFFKKRGLG
jgi:hypothetical protein